MTASKALIHGTQLTYVGFDQEIPTADLLTKLGYGDLVGISSFETELMNWRGSFPETVPDGRHQLRLMNDNILELHIGEATNIQLPRAIFDLIYLDAFDPRTNPTLWSPEFIKRLYNGLIEGGCLATYSSAGHVRRALEGCRFSVVRRPGPPGKREVLAAWKISSTDPK